MDGGERSTVVVWQGQCGELLARAGWKAVPCPTSNVVGVEDRRKRGPERREGDGGLLNKYGEAWLEGGGWGLAEQVRGSVVGDRGGRVAVSGHFGHKRGQLLILCDSLG
jgi:hypothetical protein